MTLTMEYLILGLFFILALFFLGRHLWRILSGKRSCDCANCPASVADKCGRNKLKGKGGPTPEA